MSRAVAQDRLTWLRWFFGALLLWAAVSKLANPVEFLGTLYAYQLPLPRSFLQVTAVVFPWLELLCGLLLLAGHWSETALVSLAGMMAVFLLATGQAWARGLEISCGCFNLGILGLSAQNTPALRFFESVPFSFFRNLVLAALALLLLARQLRSAAPAAATPAR